MKIFRMNRKAISPIFATLILIAIAVIAGVVVYAFTAGFLSQATGGGPVANEKVTIQAAQADSTTKVSVYAQAQGSEITVSNALIKNSAGVVVQNIASTGIDSDYTPTSGTANVGTTLTTLTITTTALDAGSYTVTLVSANGNQFVSPSFTVA